jgi:hypothetical protein
MQSVTVYKKLIFLVMSIFATLSLPYTLQVSEPMFLSNSIFSVFICYGFFLIIQKAYSLSNNLPIKKSLLIYAFSYLLSFFLVFGRNLSLFGNINYNFLYVFKIILITIGISFICNAILQIIIHLIMVKKIFLILDNTKISKFFQKNIFIKSFFIIFLCWLPIWLCFWPGILDI